MVITSSSGYSSPKPGTNAPRIPRLHLRQRSVTLDNGTDSDGEKSRPSPTFSVYSEDTSVGEALLNGDRDRKRSSFGLEALDRLTSGSASAWRSVESRPRVVTRRAIAWSIVFGLTGTAFIAGRATAPGGIATVSLANGAEVGKGSPMADMCNPYDYEGVLLVNLTVPSENKWEPVSAPDNCQPVDFMSLIAEHTSKRELITNPDLAFMQNRTIVVFGDSIDRDHLWDFCTLTGGWSEMIGVNHPLSPPYPAGQEIPDEDYVNAWTGEREWPDFTQTRPHICHLNNNFRMLNVFHYGFRGRTHMIAHHTHFYPPARIEDRFDQILVPLLANIAKQWNASAVPDVLQITPGFWGTLRLSAEDDRERAKMLEEGATEEEADLAHGKWHNMRKTHRDWLQMRMEQVLRHLGKGFLPNDADAEELRTRKPAIFWRTLHHIKESPVTPYNRIQSVDQIGRAVVKSLIAEGHAALMGASTWKAWGRKASHYASKYVTGLHREPENEVLQAGLGSRLHMDEWGAMMLGQEKHFKDTLHPMALPGSYLWGNMVLQQLKMLVQAEEEAASKE